MDKAKYNPIKVLIIDDDEVTVKIGKKALLNKGYEVFTSYTGENALEFLKTNIVDIILLDVFLDGMDGFTVCKKIKQDKLISNIPIIFMTSLKDRESILKGQRIGAVDFIIKPVNWDILSYRLQYIYRTTQDKLKLQHTLIDIKNSELHLIDTQKIARLGSWEWDIKFNRFVCSKQALEILNLNSFSPNESIGYDQFISYMVKDDRLLILNLLRNVIKNGKQEILNTELHFEDKRIKYIELRFSHKGNKVVGSIQDVTEQKLAENKIFYLANYDKLTGLPNHHQFYKHVENQLSISKTKLKKMAVLFIDIDWFKKINDSFGHTAGDELLKILSQRFKNICENSNQIFYTKNHQKQPIECFVSRFGGDEFLILLPNLPDSLQAARFSNQILNLIKEPTTLNGQSIVVTASIGISIYPDDGDNIDRLLKNAGAAMYNVKNRFRDNYLFYSSSMNSKALEKLTLENELRHAISKQQLMIYYQPKIASDSNTISGVEALIRWKHPTYGIILPDDFINLAEEINIIDDLSEWVINIASEQLQKWINVNCFNIFLSINLSNYQFHNGQLYRIIKSILDRRSLPPNLIEFEITESTLIRNVDESLKILNSLISLGVTITIDDFGTGYSSFSYLKDLPLSGLKIDKSFIDSITQNKDSAEIVKALINLSHALQLKVTAEGVENQSQVEFLIRNHCDFLQGNYFSKPLPADEIEILLDQQHKNNK